MPTQIEQRQSERATPSTHKSQRILIAVVSLLTALAVLVVVAARQWPFTREDVTKALQRQSGSEVQVGNFRETFFPHPGCVAEGVVFRKNSNMPALATIKKLAIVASYSGLLTHHLDTVRADGLRVVIAEGAGPASPIGIGQTSSGVTIGQLIADGAEVEFPAEEQGNAPVFRIPKLVLHDVEDNRPLSFQTTVQLPKPPGVVDVSGKFGPWQSGQAGQTRLAGSYSLHDLDLGIFGGVAGKLAGKGDFDGVLQHVKVQGSVDAPNFEVRESNHPVHLAAQYAATVNGLNGDVDIDAARAHFRKTTIVGAGLISGQGSQKGKVATIDLSSDHARIEDLLWMFASNPTPAMMGPIVFRAKVKIPPENKRFLDKIKLEGDFGISGAQYPHPDTQKNIDVLSARARGEADKVGDQQAKAKGEDYDPGRVLSNLKGHVVLSDAVAHLTDVYFEVPGASAKVSGTYNLRTRKVDLQGHMYLQAELSKATTGVTSMLLKVIQPFMHKSKKKESVVAIKIGGTFGNPTYAVVPKAEK